MLSAAEGASVANDLHCDVTLAGLHSYGTRGVKAEDATLRILGRAIRLESRFEGGGRTHSHTTSFSPFFRSRFRQWWRTWAVLSGWSGPIPVVRRDVTWVSPDQLSATLEALGIPLHPREAASPCLVLTPSWPGDFAMVVLFRNESDSRQVAAVLDELFRSERG